MADSVRFPPNIGGSGRTYTNDANPDTGMFNGGHRTNLFPMLDDTVQAAGYVSQYAQAIDGAKGNADRAEDARGYVEAVAAAVELNILEQYRAKATLDLDFARGKYAFDDGERIETNNPNEILSISRSGPRYEEGPVGLIQEFGTDTLARTWRNGNAQGLACGDAKTNFLPRSDEAWLSPWYGGGSVFFNVEHDDGFVPLVGHRPVSFYGPTAGAASFSTNISYCDVDLTAGTYTLSALLKFKGSQAVSEPTVRTLHRGVSGSSGTGGSLLGRLVGNGGSRGSSSDSGSGMFGTTKILQCTPAGAGWYFYEEEFELLESGTVQIRLFPYDGSSGYTGDGETGILRTRMQINRGEGSSGYIPTGSSAVTRPKDLIESENLPGFSALNGFTIFGSFISSQIRDSPDTGSGILSLNNVGGGASSPMRFYVRNDINRFRFDSLIPGAEIPTITFSASPAFSKELRAFAFSFKDGRQVLNLEGEVFELSEIMDAAAIKESTKRLGIFDYGAPGNRPVGEGVFKRLTILPYAVTRTECDEIVSVLKGDS